VSEALEIQEIQDKFLREAGFNLTNLRNQVQLMYWSEQHFITQELLDLIPFGEILSDIRFYSYINYSLDELISKANQTLLYWRLSGVTQYDGTPLDQLSLFYDETFLWHYSVPSYWEEICSQIQSGHRVRFPDFSCCKLKLKWSSTKFDSRQTLMMTSNSSTLTVTPINTNLQTLGGNPSVPSSCSLLSTHLPFHSQLQYLMPLEERLSTRPILTRFRAFPTTSTSRTTTGTASTLPQPIPLQPPTLTPQVLVQTLTTGLPPTFNLHPQPQNPDPPTPPVCAFVALTFVIVIPSSQEHPQHPLVFLSGTQSTVINL